MYRYSASSFVLMCVQAHFKNMSLCRRKSFYLTLILLAIGGLLISHAPSIQENFEEKSARSCDVTTSIPFWSRGFARSCCDVFPTIFGNHAGGFFESGVESDPTYFIKREIKSGDIVYVVTSDIPKFLEIFHKLKGEVRITLVTGGEDIGVPWEIFHPDRVNFFDYKMSSLWPNGQLMTMREFLGDVRLLRWYTQNYDMVGNNSFTSSDIDVVVDKSLIAKVFPLPIGLDFHTLAEKNRRMSTYRMADSLCDQRRSIASALSASSPFLERNLSVYAEFDCLFSAIKSRHIRKMTRGTVCKLLQLHDQNKSAGGSHDSQLIFIPPITGNKRKMSTRDAKIFFWSNVAQVQFALAPPGFGIDTHRAWEILNLHTIPIVMSSSLDRLYEMFPVIIVQNWSEVFEEGSLHRFQSRIVARFGKDPFSKKVDEMLRADYWIDMIRNSSEAV